MIRLLKLMILVAVGYALYDFFQGLNVSGGMQQPQRQRGQRRERAIPQSNPQNITGPGKGRRVDIDVGDDYATQGETVGRGVVRR